MSRLSQHPPRPGAGREPQDAGLTLRTLSGFKWALLTSGGQALLSLAIVMTLSRLLAPQDFGMLAIALVFFALAETAGRSGLGPALVQRYDLTERHIATALTLAVGVAVPLAAALWVLAPLLCSLVGEPQAAPVLRTLSFATALGLYTRAGALAVVSARLGPVMMQVLLPAMARRQHRIERLRAVHRGGIEMLSLAALPASLMIAVAAPEIVAVVLGPRSEGAAGEAPRRGM